MGTLSPGLRSPAARLADVMGSRSLPPVAVVPQEMAFLGLDQIREKSSAHSQDDEVEINGDAARIRIRFKLEFES